MNVKIVNFIHCKKVTNYDPKLDRGFADGITYARTDVENKDGDCIHYKKRKVFTKIINFFTT